MAEIGGQRADVLVEVHPGAMPPDQGVDGKAVSQIMYPRAHCSGADADGDGDLPERLVYAAAGEGRADAGEEEGPRARSRAQPVTLGGVAAQRLGGRRVQRHQPGAVELRLPDHDDTGHQVDVVALQTNRLPKAQPRGSEQSEQRLVSRRPQRRAQRPRCFQQSTDTAGRPQVGGRAVAARREHTGRWHLGRRVDRLQVLRKSAGDGEALRPVLGLCPLPAGAPTRSRARW